MFIIVITLFNHPIRDIYELVKIYIFFNAPILHDNHAYNKCP